VLERDELKVRVGDLATTLEEQEAIYKRKLESL
jgi:hypothetical protein